MRFFSKHKTEIIEDLKIFSKVLKQLNLAENKWWEFAREIESKTIEDYSQFISKDFNSYVQKFKEEIEILRESHKIKEELKLVQGEEHIKKFLDDLTQLDNILTYQQNSFKSHLNLKHKPSQKEFEVLLNFLKQNNENESTASQLMNNLIHQLEIEDKTITDDNFDKQVIKCAQIIERDKIIDNVFLSLFEEAVKQRNFGIKGEDAEIPLHWACEKGNKDLALEMIKIYPEAIKIQDNTGWTPLHWAMRNGNKDLALEMIKIYPEAIKIQTEGGWTPLHCACGNGHKDLALEMIKIYLEAIKIQDKEGWTPLHWACYNGHKDLALEMIKIYPKAIKIQDKDGETHLHCAMHNGNKDLALEMIKIYPEAIKIQDNNGWTPLHWIMRKGFKNIIKYILDNNLEINEVDRDKWEEFRTENHRYTDRIKRMLNNK